MNDISAVYKEKLPGKIKEILDLWATLKSNYSLDIHKNLKEKIHKLHGSAGMYGYKKISMQADQIENILNTMNVPIKPETMNNLEKLFNSLQL